LMMSLWDALRMNMMISYQELVRTFLNDFMEEQEVFDLLKKKKTAVWNLRKNHGFPHPVLTYPTRYSRKAVIKWIEDGGVNRGI
ncbi:hypothetical protein V6078_25660, partial [Klebsiella pneumoniae]